ncbi:MAG: hypothetical protein ACRERE_14890 [Candidatus Entotheonellia bacterium]
MRLKAAYCMLILLAGCSQVPKPSTYPYSFQHKMQAAHHWNVLANGVAAELTASFRGGSVSSVETVYVQSDDRSPFGRAFRTFLITELTKQGISVSVNPDTPLKIDWAVQLVVHQADRSNPPFLLANTLLAGLAYGVGIAWSELDAVAAGAVTAGVVGPLLDILPGMDFGPLPHSEVIITTMITRTGAILARNTTPFYINDEDRQHYWSRPDMPGTPTPLVQKSYTVVNR